MEKNSLDIVIENLGDIVKDLDNLKKYKTETIEQMELIKKELEGLKDIKADILTCISNLLETVKESKDFLVLVKTTISNSYELLSEIHSQVDRMSDLSKIVSNNIEEAKRLETRLMLEKMEIMIKQAESLNTIINTATRTCQPSDNSTVSSPALEAQTNDFNNDN